MPKQKNNKQPIRVAYDILKMSAGRGNGGIKTHHYEFLRHFAERPAHKLQLLVFCRSEVVEELEFLSANPLNQIHVHGTRQDYEFRDDDGEKPPLHFWPQLPEGLLQKLGVDVLYAGFGDSQLHENAIPQISLLVDVLHKDLPDMLPPQVVVQRDIDFQNAIAQADLIQTNSRFCVESLKKHYGIPHEKLFHIYLPLHSRFNLVETGPLPECLKGKQYFFYPAQLWPHKNHETLLVAFRKFIIESELDLHLAFTGTDDNRTAELIELSETLGLASKTNFLGTLDDSTYKAIWELSSSLIFPSLYEGSCIPILEALRFQKPIVASKIPPIFEIAKSQPFYFDPRNPLSISDALKKATNQTQRRNDTITLPSLELSREACVLYEHLLRIIKSPSQTCD